MTNTLGSKVFDSHDWLYILENVFFSKIWNTISEIWWSSIYDNSRNSITNMIILGILDSKIILCCKFWFESPWLSSPLINGNPTNWLHISKKNYSSNTDSNNVSHVVFHAKNELDIPGVVTLDQTTCNNIKKLHSCLQTKFVPFKMFYIPRLPWN